MTTKKKAKTLFVHSEDVADNILEKSSARMFLNHHDYGDTSYLSYEISEVPKDACYVSGSFNISDGFTRAGVDFSVYHGDITRGDENVETRVARELEKLDEFKDMVDAYVMGAKEALKTFAIIRKTRCNE